MALCFVLLWTSSSAHADEYWRGWCAGSAHVRYGEWVLDARRQRQDPTTFTPQQKHALAQDRPDLWPLHEQPYTFLWNGKEGPLWVTCPSGETAPYNWEAPEKGRPRK
jgi:hypothetical protein